MVDVDRLQPQSHVYTGCSSVPLNGCLLNGTQHHACFVHGSHISLHSPVSLENCLKVVGCPNEADVVAVDLVAMIAHVNPPGSLLLILAKRLAYAIHVPVATEAEHQLVAEVATSTDALWKTGAWNPVDSRVFAVASKDELKVAMCSIKSGNKDDQSRVLYILNILENSTAGASVPVVCWLSCGTRLLVSCGCTHQVITWEFCKNGDPHSWESVIAPHRSVILGLSGPVRCLQPGPDCSLLITKDAPVIINAGDTIAPVTAVLQQEPSTDQGARDEGLVAADSVPLTYSADHSDDDGLVDLMGKWRHEERGGLKSLLGLVKTSEPGNQEYTLSTSTQHQWEAGVRAHTASREAVLLHRPGFGGGPTAPNQAPPCCNTAAGNMLQDEVSNLRGGRWQRDKSSMGQVEKNSVTAEASNGGGSTQAVGGRWGNGPSAVPAHFLLSNLRLDPEPAQLCVVWPEELGCFGATAETSTCRLPCVPADLGTCGLGGESKCNKPSITKGRCSRVTLPLARPDILRISGSTVAVASTTNRPVVLLYLLTVAQGVVPLRTLVLDGGSWQGERWIMPQLSRIRGLLVLAEEQDCSVQICALLGTPIKPETTSPIFYPLQRAAAVHMDLHLATYQTTTCHQEIKAPASARQDHTNRLSAAAAIAAGNGHAQEWRSSATSKAQPLEHAVKPDTPALGDPVVSMSSDSLSKKVVAQPPALLKCSAAAEGNEPRSAGAGGGPDRSPSRWEQNMISLVVGGLRELQQHIDQRFDMVEQQLARQDSRLDRIETLLQKPGLQDWL